jgi:hypothetical protein
MDRLRCQELALHGPRGNLCAEAEAQFGQDVSNVRVDRPFTDDELLGNLTIRIAARDEYGDFALAAGEHGCLRRRQWSDRTDRRLRGSVEVERECDRLFRRHRQTGLPSGCQLSLGEACAGSVQSGGCVLNTRRGSGAGRGAERGRRPGQLNGGVRTLGCRGEARRTIERCRERVGVRCVARQVERLGERGPGSGLIAACE